MEISIKWNICRVCLQEEKKSNKKDSSSNISFVHLFEENKKLALQIFELSGVCMKPNDSLPDKICNKCVAIVKNAVQFRKTCRSSNTYLQSILERTKSASTLLKPELSTCQIDNDDGYNGNPKTADLTLEHELEHNVEEENEKVTVCDKKNKDDTQISHTLYSLEQQEDEVELELNDNISDYTVELEEIIEMSDEDETVDAEGNNAGSLFPSESIAQSSKENLSLNKSGISQKLSANDSFSKERNTEREQYDCNANDSDFAISVKTCEVDEDEVFKEDEDSVSEKYMEFVDVDQEENSESNIEETVMVDAVEQMNGSEDQAQVSSTVQTKEEIEYYEDNSNISNLSSDLYKERVTNENISNCNISSSKLSEADNDRKATQKLSTTEDSKSPTIFSKRKAKRNFFNSVAYEPVQVCVCEICGNRFTNQNKMKLHMKIHLQYKNHQCELCFKRFITACNLQAHMRIHTGEKPFECKYCGRRFNDRSSHIRHERTHTNEKPFECVNCGKSFTLATTLQNHMKVHSNERSYRCEPCGKSFKLPHHLKKHQSTTLHRSVLQIADDES